MIDETNRFGRPGVRWKKRNESNMIRFKDYIKENDGGGVAMTTLGNTGGMGNVVAPQPSATPGDVAGSTKGSGDLPATAGTYTKSNFKKRKKKKKRIEQSKLGEDYHNMYVTKFSDWTHYPEKKINESL